MPGSFDYIWVPMYSKERIRACVGIRGIPNTSIYKCVIPADRTKRGAFYLESLPISPAR